MGLIIRSVVLIFLRMGMSFQMHLVLSPSKARSEKSAAGVIRYNHFSTTNHLKMIKYSNI